MKILSDFDGVWTDQALEAENVKIYMAAEAARFAEVSGDDARGHFRTFEERVQAAPAEYGWAPDGRITAYVDEDPFCVLNSIAMYLERAGDEPVARRYREAILAAGEVDMTSFADRCFLTATADYREQHPPALVPHAKEALEARGSEVTGLSTGFRDLDRKLTGLHPANLLIIAARPAMGKSALTTNIATNVAMTGTPVAIFSLEMSKEEMAQRMLCSVARIDSMKLRTGQIGENAWPRLTDAAGSLFNAPVFVDGSAVATVTDIRAKCRRLKRAHGLGLIVVDYLQLMQGVARENRQQEIAEISRSLKNLARELELPVIAVSQLNRNLESREDKRPRLGDLRESGSLEQDADIVIFIYRDEYYNERSEKKGIAEVAVAKHRAGSTGIVEMTFMPEFTRFSDLGRD